jgi:hypothetical protein
MSDQQYANDVQPEMIVAIRVRAGSNILNPLRYPIATNELEAKGCEKIRSTAEVDLDDGRTLVEEADERYRGGPDLRFAREELHERFRDCASLVLPPSAIEEVFSIVETLEGLSDVTELSPVLSAGTAVVAQ